MEAFSLRIHTLCFSLKSLATLSNSLFIALKNLLFRSEDGSLCLSVTFYEMLTTDDLLRN
ncbi:hypothetical protein X975_04042, partial [Stegodyphus mimosarum]